MSPTDPPRPQIAADAAGSALKLPSLKRCLRTDPAHLRSQGQSLASIASGPLCVPVSDQPAPSGRGVRRLAEDRWARFIDSDSAVARGLGLQPGFMGNLLRLERDVVMLDRAAVDLARGLLCALRTATYALGRFASAVEQRQADAARAPQSGQQERLLAEALGAARDDQEAEDVRCLFSLAASCVSRCAAMQLTTALVPQDAARPQEDRG